MIRRRSARTLLIVGAAVLTPLLSSCATTVDSVNPQSYITPRGDGWYRIQTPAPASSPPIAVVYPDSCKSPPSRMGAPAGC